MDRPKSLLSFRRVGPVEALALCTLAVAHFAPGAFAGDLAVVSTSPVGGSLNNSVHSAVSVTFDRPVNTASFTLTNHRFYAYGRWSGPAEGTVTFSNGDTTATLTPDDPFFPGETVFVILSHDLQADDGSNLRAAGYAFSFWTHARRAPMTFAVLDTLDCRTTPAQGTRAYGGIGSDLNNDGHSDLTVVQEDTADLRVFLNTADGAGTFQPFLQPTFPVGNRASPSEPADFDHDGNVDICVADINDNTVSVLLGNGDGTFSPRQIITVGAAPRGIAVLDFNGDGLLDIANTNSNAAGNTGNVSLMTNLGGGNFSSPVFFEGGGSREFALAAADMNHDGIFDLVIGAQGSQTMIVQRGDGDGTFTFGGSIACGGRTWMIALGDVDGDGHEDVVSANSSTNNASVLKGNVTGVLSAAQTYTVAAFPLATDVGDLDGDGDLDWTTSSFSGGQWHIFRNNGAGVYATHQVVPAPSAGSCTVLHDFDNDGDNDVSLIDELADVVQLLQNTGVAVAGDFEGDGDADLLDYDSFQDCVGPAAVPVDCEVFDVDGDRDVDFRDFAGFQLTFTGPLPPP